MTQAIAEYQPHELALPDRAYLERELRAVREFQALAQQLLVRGQDFGTIPGTDKPTLFKPGAEKIAKLLGLADRYEIVDKTEDWDRPLFRYLVRCSLVSVRTGVTVSECMGECNSMESRYRWRNAQRLCPQCKRETIFQSKPPRTGYYCWVKRGGCGAQYRANDPAITGQVVGQVLNDDIYALVNTLLKMAQKRALVGASLSAGRLSEVFTQDMEDISSTAVEAEYTEIDSEPAAHEPHPTAARPASAPTVLVDMAHETQTQIIRGLSARQKWSTADLRGHLGVVYGVQAVTELSAEQAADLISYLEMEGKPRK